MKSFNLLPWREIRNRQRDRVQLFACAGIWLACAALVLIFRFQLTLQQTEQQSRNDFLNQHIAQLDEQIEQIAALDEQREQLVKRIEIIQDLQRERILFGTLLQELVLRMPDGVYLEEMAKTDEQLSLAGVALSNAAVSDLMSRLEASPWLVDAELQAIESVDGAGPAGQPVERSHFMLDVNVKPQAGDEHES